MVDTTAAMGKPSIAIIGAGRVGSTLARALHAAGYPIVAVWSRTPTHAAELAAEVGASVEPLRHIARQAALTLIAVSDDSIAHVVAELATAGAALHGRMIVHCSGVQPAAVLGPVKEAGALIGGFHPLAAIAASGCSPPINAPCRAAGLSTAAGSTPLQCTTICPGRQAPASASSCARSARLSSETASSVIVACSAVW